MASRVLVSLRVKATAERAFDVFTREIGAWWRPNILFQFTPRSPGVLSFDGESRLIETMPDGKVFEIGRVTAWEWPRRLAFGWRQATFAPEQHTHVEILFEPAGEDTRITVTHTGWDAIPAEHVARHGFPDVLFLQRHAEWWQALLASFGERAG